MSDANILFYDDLQPFWWPASFWTRHQGPCTVGLTFLLLRQQDPRRHRPSPSAPAPNRLGPGRGCRPGGSTPARSRGRALPRWHAYTLASPSVAVSSWTPSSYTQARLYFPLPLCLVYIIFSRAAVLLIEGAPRMAEDAVWTDYAERNGTRNDGWITQCILLEQILFFFLKLLNSS